MIRFKIHTPKGVRDAIVPEGWHEVTLQQMVSFDELRSTDPVSLMAVFCDQSLEDLTNTPSNIWEPFNQVISFVFDPPPWNKLKVPKYVELNGKRIKVPRKLKLESFGQKVMASQIMLQSKTDEDMIKMIPDLITVYFQKLYDGKFDTNRLEDVKPYVMNLSCLDAIPIGRFFFFKLLKPKNYGKIGLNLFQRITIKRDQIFHRLENSQ